MVGEWREYRVGEIADIVGGSTPSTGDPSNFEGYIPWNTPKDLSGPHERYKSRGERNLSRKGLEGATPGRRGAGGAGLGREMRARIREGGQGGYRVGTGRDAGAPEEGWSGADTS